jgi:hypothetical protein
MRFLKFFGSKRRDAQSEAASSLAQRGDGGSESPEFLTPGDYDIEKLAQFRAEARLVKQVPIDRSRPPRSWNGGKPQMPDYFAWPIAEGKPMVFVAQIDCSDLPRDLWGGVGPRAGWMLVFLGPTYPQHTDASDLPVRIIHTTDLGRERNRPATPKVDWFSSRMGSASPDVAAFTFPKWPVTIHGKAADAPELSIRFDRNKGSHDGARPNPNGLPWPGGMAGNPLTPVGLKMLYDSLTRDLEGRIEGATRLISKFTELLERGEDPDEVQGQSAQVVEKWQHHRDRARRGLPKLQETLPKNLAALGELRAVIERHPVANCPDLMSTQDWGPIATALAQITTARWRWITTRWSQRRYEGEVYRDERFELVRPDTLGELSNSLTTIIRAISALEKKLEGRVRRREGLLQRHAALSPEQQAAISDRARFELDHSARTLETAKSHVHAARGAWKKLIDLRGGLTDGKDGKLPVSDHVWGTALEAVSGIVVADFDLEVLLPEITAREEIDVAMEAGLRPDSTLEAYRHIVASNLYAENPNRLPQEVLAHFEPIWASAALEKHDGMGGGPRGDIDFRYFCPELFWTPEAQKPFRDEGTRVHFAPPPFDQDNALLLQLVSDRLMGWMWGDLYHLVLLVPRDDLAKAKFDNVIAIVTN